MLLMFGKYLNTSIVDYCDAHLRLDAAQVGEFARVEGPQRPARLPRDALPAVHPQEAVPVVPAAREGERGSVSGGPLISGSFSEYGRRAVGSMAHSHIALKILRQGLVEPKETNTISVLYEVWRS